MEKINMVVEKYMPLPFDLNQQAQNDDNNRNYGGGRTR